MKTLAYLNERIEEIEIGKTYFLGQLWDGNGDGLEILESCSVSPDNENVVAFEIIEVADGGLQAIVRVIDIY